MGFFISNGSACNVYSFPFIFISSRRNGGLGGNSPLDLQKKFLEKEGIRFDKNQTIDLKKYLWR